MTYLGQFFCPVGLAVFYPHPESNLPVWQVVGAVLVLACISAGALACWRRRPYVLVGWLWYLGMLVPVIGLVQVGMHAAADRYTYLPQIGLYIALAWGARDACRSWPYRRWLCGVTSALVLAVLMGCAWRQTSFGAATRPSGLTPWLVLRKTSWPTSNFAMALLTRGRIDEAIAQYRRAVEIRPDFADDHYNLGTVLGQAGKYDEAIVQLQQAVKIQPGDMRFHNNLGMALAARGRFDEAVAQYWKALEIKPDHVESLNNLAWLRATCPQASLRNGAEAIAHAQHANQLCGGQRPDVLNTLAAAYAEAGRFPEALATARKAVALAVQQNKRALPAASRAWIPLYEAGKPYRQTPAASAPAPKP